jgi:predicted nucleotidyltransferase component of viral defense system
MALPDLLPFSLVGGTALSLQYGHRSSDDLDLFYHRKFNIQQTIEALESRFQSKFAYKQQHTGVGIFCFIDNIKVDFVYYPHLLIDTIKEEVKIRMYSIADLSAMKIQAILGRAKKKDFWDLYELLQHYSLKQLIDWHKQKYPSQMLAISIPEAITYFVDAEESESPVSFKKQNWEGIKKGIQRAVNDYLK